MSSFRGWQLSWLAVIFALKSGTANKAISKMTFSTTRPMRLRQGLLCAIAAAALCSTAAGVATAQADRGMQGGEEHPGWGQDRGPSYTYHRGERMGYNDWNNAPVIDYRVQNTGSASAKGYEWREHNGHYVLVAIATGLIASVILSGGQ